VNVSEKVRALLAERETNTAERNVRTGVEKRTAGDWRLREPSGTDLRRWARGQERMGRKEQRWQVAAQERRRRRAAPNARELFPVLQAKRLAARPIVGYTEGGAAVYGPSTFRNIINENGRHV
jgi:hypothetical protein